MNTAIELVIDLPFLAREINDAHRQVQFHGKSMLMEAKRAGEALLEAKKALKLERGAYSGPEQGAPPVFKDWVEKSAGVAYPTAAEYMRVVKHAKGMDLHTFQGGIRAFLDAHATPRQPEPVAPREFTREDAERALKFHALATRGATEGEQAAASSKLASFAKEFGMTPEAMADKAKAMFPDVEKTEGEARREKAEAGWKDAAERLAKHDAIAARLRAEFSKATKEDLIDVLAGALMRLEEAGLG